MLLSVFLHRNPTYEGERSPSCPALSPQRSDRGVTEKSQPQSLIPPETELESPFDPSAPPFWEIVAELAAEIPDEIWETVPEDASDRSLPTNRAIATPFRLSVFKEIKHRESQE